MPGWFSHRSCAVILRPDVQAIAPYFVHALNQGHTTMSCICQVLQTIPAHHVFCRICTCTDGTNRWEHSCCLCCRAVAPNATGIEKVVYEWHQHRDYESGWSRSRWQQQLPCGSANHCSHWRGSSVSILVVAIWRGRLFMILSRAHCVTLLLSSCGVNHSCCDTINSGSPQLE